MFKGRVRGINAKEQTSTVNEHTQTIIRSPYWPLEGVNGCSPMTSPVLTMNVPDPRTG